MSDDDAPFSIIRVRAAPKWTASADENIGPVEDREIPSEEKDESGHAVASKKKRKAASRRKQGKLHSVPILDAAFTAPPEDAEEGGLHAVRSYDSFSSEMAGADLTSSEADSVVDADPAEEIPTDTNTEQIIHLSKGKRSSKLKAKKSEEGDQSDDEKGGYEESSESSDDEVDNDVKDGNLDKKGSREGQQPALTASGDIVIPMEGRQKSETSSPVTTRRAQRFRLNRNNPTKEGRRPSQNEGSGSRFFWGGHGAVSSFDEDSQPETMELTPLELARIHASMRRSKATAVVPGIYDRPRNVLEAALIPSGTDPDMLANGLDGHSRLSTSKTPSKNATDTEMEELGNLDGRDSERGDFEPPTLTLIPKYPLEELIPFLTLLAKTFHSYGATVNRTEWNMREVSEILGVTANYAVMPTQITITFGLPEGMDAVSRTFRCDQNLVECGRLFMVEKLINKILTEDVDLYQARDELQTIINRTPNFSLPIRILSMAIASGSSAVLFFNGGWAELIISFILGFVIALLDWASTTSLAFARVVEIISALIVASVAVPVTYYVPDACFSGIVLSSLVWLLPGLTLTLAVRELATRNMVAGTVRMFSAFMTSLKLGFGISFGSFIPFWIPKGTITAACSAPLSQWWYVLFFITTVIPFNILLDTQFHQWPGQLATSGVGFLISWVFSRYTQLPSELISVLSAFGVGLVGNGYSLWSKTSGVVYIVSGILLLVPGSVGVKGATAFFDKDAWSGLQFSFTMVIIGFSITVGTLVADLMIFPRREFIHFAF